MCVFTIYIRWNHVNFGCHYLEICNVLKIIPQFSVSEVFQIILLGEFLNTQSRMVPNNENYQVGSKNKLSSHWESLQHILHGQGQQLFNCFDNFSIIMYFNIAYYAFFINLPQFTFKSPKSMCVCVCVLTIYIYKVKPCEYPVFDSFWPTKTPLPHGSNLRCSFWKKETWISFKKCSIIQMFPKLEDVVLPTMGEAAPTPSGHLTRAAGSSPILQMDGPKPLSWGQSKLPTCHSP